MSIKDLIDLLADNEKDIRSKIEVLMFGRKLPDVEKYKKQFDVYGHATMDITKRQDKPVKDSDGNIDRYEKVNRLGVALQDLITERAVSFLFGNPVQITCKTEGTSQESLFDAYQRVMKDNKIDSFNAEIALEMFRATEVAELWYTLDKKEIHNDYGFSTRFKIRVQAFNPWDGNDLYPLKDETGDMIAFSRGFSIDQNNKKVKYFETRTADRTIIWNDQGTGEWMVKEDRKNESGKINVVFGQQPEVEWHKVENLIERLEYLLSNFADTNDYHASPKIVIDGEVISFSKKGESGSIIEMSEGGSAKYLSWDHAPESIKLEVENLFKLIYSLTQTPDISFESVKNLGQISGVALKMLFLDATLKVKKKQRIFDAYLERRTNVIKGLLASLNRASAAELNKMNIVSEIQPFTIDDEQANLELVMTANGSKPVISRKTAIRLANMVEDVDEEFKLIQAEEKEALAVSVVDNY